MSLESPAIPLWRSTLRAFQSVAWSFFGIRKGSESQKDLSQVKPAQLIFVGLVSGLLFVIGLIVVVNLIV
jgi:amino acid transporter